MLCDVSKIEGPNTEQSAVSNKNVLIEEVKKLIQHIVSDQSIDKMPLDLK